MKHSFISLFTSLVRRNLSKKDINSVDSSLIKSNVIDFAQSKIQRERSKKFSELAVDVFIEEQVILQLNGFIRADAERILIMRKEMIKSEFPEFFPRLDDNPDKQKKA